MHQKAHHLWCLESWYSKLYIILECCPWGALSLEGCWWTRPSWLCTDHILPAAWSGKGSVVIYGGDKAYGNHSYTYSDRMIKRLNLLLFWLLAFKFCSIPKTEVFWGCICLEGSIHILIYFLSEPTSVALNQHAWPSSCRLKETLIMDLIIKLCP